MPGIQCILNAAQEDLYKHAPGPRRGAAVTRPPNVRRLGLGRKGSLGRGGPRRFYVCKVFTCFYGFMFPSHPLSHQQADLRTCFFLRVDKMRGWPNPFQRGKTRLRMTAFCPCPCMAWPIGTPNFFAHPNQANLMVELPQNFDVRIIGAEDSSDCAPVRRCGAFRLRVERWAPGSRRLGGPKSGTSLFRFGGL